MITDFTNKRVTVMGLGRFGGGVGAVRWLAVQGARVTVSDREPTEKLADSIAALADYDVDFQVGGHREEDFRDADLVVVNPAVPHDSPYPQIAADAGVPVTTEINLFIERNPAPVIGVTGSVGKSTTVAMIQAILVAAHGPERVWVGGNFGDSLLGDLPQIQPDHFVVLELSSFQLQRTAALRWSPQIAVITNLLPNHLDWHGTFAHYAAAKLNIVRFQDPSRDLIVMHDTEALRRNFMLMFGDLAGIWRYRAGDRSAHASLQATSDVESDNRFADWDNLSLQVPGKHNLLNAAGALTVAHALDIEDATAVRAVESFAGLPHRVARVGEVDGVTYVDDSKASSPDAALTAMRALDGPLLQIAGGYDKGLDLSEFARELATNTKFVACIGQTGPRLAEMISQSGGKAAVVTDMQDAVHTCAANATAGDTVLLSPGSASWGMFADFRERGMRFVEIVQQLRERAASTSA